MNDLKNALVAMVNQKLIRFETINVLKAISLLEFLDHEVDLSSGLADKVA